MRSTRDPPDAEDITCSPPGRSLHCVAMMQGLIISSQDTSKKEEAFELARKGIKNNLKSHVTWHVFG